MNLIRGGHTMRTQIGIWSAILTVSIAFQSSVWAQTFHALGFLPDANTSVANDVSLNGVVVGTCSGGGTRAFRWSLSTGIQEIPNAQWPGRDSAARAISLDGRAVAGEAWDYSGHTYPSFWWQGNHYSVALAGVVGSTTDITVIGGFNPMLVGWGHPSLGQPPRGFWYSFSTGFQDFGANIIPWAISGDGSVVAGIDYTHSPARGWRWTASTGIQYLPTLGGAGSSALGISFNGRYIVGSAARADGQRRPCRWDGTANILNLGLPPNTVSATARAVSADGNLIVGTATDRFGLERAVRWRVSGNTVIAEDLNQVYSAIISGGWLLTRAYSISADGRYIVGEGIDPEGRTQAWMIDTGGGAPPIVGDVNGDGCVDDADLLLVLFNFGSGC